MLTICRKTQAELSERSLEATELQEALEERQRELEERVSTVIHHRSPPCLSTVFIHHTVVSC